MIQDILPRVYHNEYRPKEPAPDDRVFMFCEGRILAEESAEGDLRFPRVGEILDTDGFMQDEGRLRYLFSIDEAAYYLDMEPVSVPEIKGHDYKYKDLKLVRRVHPKDECFAAMTAWHLFSWYRANRFCGKCGHAMVHAEDARMLRCPVCDNQIYPRINPAVIVGVTDRDKIMITRYAGRPYKGNALISGFCEIGEAVEDTVRREVMEETGLHVKNIRYYKSQPWGFAGELLMGFFCEVDGSRTVHMDDQELAVAHWVSREEIGVEAAELSLTADMIMHFKHEVDLGEEMDAEELKEHLSLPSRIRSIWHGHRPGIPEHKGVAAVIIPLVLMDGAYHIVYEQRAAGLIHQPGEICYPGGRVETGESPLEAALRETAEELLIATDQIEVLAALDAQMGPSGAPIWPFVAVLKGYEGTFSKDEVDRIFTIPVSWFEQHEPERHKVMLVTSPREDFPFALIPGGRRYPFRKKEHEIVFYRTPEAVIWGVTARITDDFIRQLK